MAITAKTVFCDDVRLEASGKFFLIGVYGGFMRAESTPSAFRISTWVQIEGLDVGTHKVSLHTLLGDGTKFRGIGHVDLAVNVFDENLPVIVSPGGLEVVTDKNEELRLVISVNDGEAIDAGAIKIFLPQPVKEDATPL